MNKNWYQSLPKKRSAAGVLFQNKEGCLLFLKPTYKDGWTIPGGIIDEGESPLQAAKRETLEETGLVVDNLKLRCVDYMSDPAKGESYQFVFHGGILSDEEINKIKLDNKEISEYRFVPIPEADRYLTAGLKKRVGFIFSSNNKDVVYYLEQGTSPENMS